MTEISIKRGYVKWEDEDGTRHKVPLVEYNAILELKGEEPLESDQESAPPRGPVLDRDEMEDITPEVPDEDEMEVPGTDETVVERDNEVAERAFPEPE